MRRYGDIGVWKGAVPPHMCEELILFFESSQKKTRDSDRCTDSYIFLYEEVLRRSYGRYLRDCGDEYFKFYGHDTWRKQSMPVTMKIQKTGPGQKGFSGLHWEQGQGLENACRYAAWMTYLNDVPEEAGGKTVFPLQGASFAPTTGTTLIWPAGYTHPHHAYPEVVTTKYIITGWLEYIPSNEKSETE